MVCTYIYIHYYIFFIYSRINAFVRSLCCIEIFVFLKAEAKKGYQKFEDILSFSEAVHQPISTQLPSEPLPGSTYS